MVVLISVFAIKPSLTLIIFLVKVVSWINFGCIDNINLGTWGKVVWILLKASIPALCSLYLYSWTFIVCGTYLHQTASSASPAETEEWGTPAEEPLQVLTGLCPAAQVPHSSAHFSLLNWLSKGLHRCLQVSAHGVLLSYVCRSANGHSNVTSHNQ